MIKVDHVYPGLLTNIVGPAGTIRRILKSRDWLVSNDLDVRVFNKGMLLSNWNNNSFLSFKSRESSLKHRVRQKLDTMARKNLLLSILLMMYNYNRARCFVKTYLRLGRHPDCVVFHSDIEAYYYLKYSPKSPKSIVFYHSDGLPLEMFYNYYPKLRGSWFARKLMKKFDYVIDNVDKCAFICKKGLENLNCLYPVVINKSFLIINGIDDLTEQQLCETNSIKTNRSDNKLRLITVGSISIRKGQRLIIEALALLTDERQEKFELTIVGEGPDYEYCSSLVEKYNLSKIVKFVGAVPNVDVYKYLAASDVFVLMSNNEGLPISIIEAMRAGLAILSTNVSGIPELVTNNNGILVDVTAESLVSVLIQDKLNDWKDMGVRSRELFMKQFTFQRMRNDYISMITSLC